MKKTQTKFTKKAGKSEDKRILSIDHLLKNGEVDTDIWEPKNAKVNSWQVGTSETEETLFQVEVQLYPYEVKDEDEVLIDLLENSLVDIAPTKFMPTPKVPKDGNLLELSLPDFVGLEVFESKGNNTKEAIKVGEEKWKSAVKEMLTSAAGANVSKILLPINATFGIIDLRKNKGGWLQNFMQAAKLLTDAVEQFAQIAPVDIQIVFGAKRNTRDHFIGTYLATWFLNNKNVTVDNSTTAHKYYKFQQNLIGLTNDQTNPNRLPNIMAEEAKALWGETIFQEWHYGGKANVKENAREHNGCTVRQVSSLTKADAMAPHKDRIVDNAKAEAFLYRPEGGLIGNFYATL